MGFGSELWVPAVPKGEKRVWSGGAAFPKGRAQVSACTLAVWQGYCHLFPGGPVAACWGGWGLITELWVHCFVQTLLLLSCEQHFEENKWIKLYGEGFFLWGTSSVFKPVDTWKAFGLRFWSHFWMLKALTRHNTVWKYGFPHRWELLAGLDWDFSVSERDQRVSESKYSWKCLA